MIEQPRIIYFESGAAPPGQMIQPTLQDQTETIQNLLQNFLPGSYSPGSNPSGSMYTFSDKLHWNVHNLGDDGHIFIEPGLGEMDAAIGTVEVTCSEPTLYTLTARNTGGSTTAKCLIKPHLPEITRFEADPDPVATPGSTSTLNWEVDRGDAVYLFPPGESVRFTGEKQVKVWEPGTFILLAANSTGSIQRQVTIDVSDYEPGIYLFEAEDDSVESGGFVNLHYIVAGLGPAARVWIDSSPPVEHLSDYNASLDTVVSHFEDEVMFKVERKTVFTLHARTGDGRDYKKTLTIQAGLTPNILSFKSSGAWNTGFVNLEWIVADAERVTLEPEFGEVALTGSERVEAVPRLYTLTAYGDPQTLIDKQTLWLGNPEVAEHANIYSYSITPQIAAQSGQDITIRWEGSGVGATLAKFRNGKLMQTFKDLPIAGSKQDAVSDTWIYVLTMVALNDTVQESITVERQFIPQIEFFRTSPGTIRFGESVKLMWETSYLGSTGTVWLQGKQVSPSDTTELALKESAKLEFKVVNQAGEDVRSAEVTVIPPEPYLLFNDDLSPSGTRTEPISMTLEVGFADSIRILEIEPGGRKLLLNTFNTDLWGITRPAFGYRPLEQFRLDMPDTSKIEVKLFQGGEVTTPPIRKFLIYPHHELEIGADISWDWLMPTVEGVSLPAIMYSLDINLNIFNNGRDTWRADLYPRVRAEISWPPYTGANYGWAEFGDSLSFPEWPNLTRMLVTIPDTLIVRPDSWSGVHVLGELPLLKDGSYTVKTSFDPDFIVFETDKKNNIVQIRFEVTTEYFEYDLGNVQMPNGSSIPLKGYYSMPYLSFPKNGMTIEEWMENESIHQ